MVREAKLEIFARVSEEKLRMLEIIKNKENVIVNHQATQEKIGSFSADAADYFLQAEEVGKTTAGLIKRLADPACTDAERNFLIKAIQSKSEEQAACVEKGNEILKKIIDSIGSDGGFPTQHIVDQYNYFIQLYKEFLSTLTLE
jgi:hypothetical protein